MTARATLVIAVLLFSPGCSGLDDTQAVLPTQPSPPVNLTPPAAPVVYAVQGTAADSAGRPVPDVVITVRTGPQTGTATITDAAGRFTLSAVTGLASIGATKNGYLEQTKPLYT